MNFQEETKKAFEEAKKQIKFTSDFETVDDIFQITDMVMQQKYISNYSNKKLKLENTMKVVHKCLMLKRSE